VEDLAISWSGTDVLLNWSALPGAASYSVYRMSQPYSEEGVLITTIGSASLLLADESDLFPQAFYYVIVNY
jgi:hypothetical protein